MRKKDRRLLRRLDASIGVEKGTHERICGRSRPDADRLISVALNMIRKGDSGNGRSTRIH